MCLFGNSSLATTSAVLLLRRKRRFRHRCTSRSAAPARLDAQRRHSVRAHDAIVGLCFRLARSSTVAQQALARHDALDGHAVRRQRCVGWRDNPITAIVVVVVDAQHLVAQLAAAALAVHAGVGARCCGSAVDRSTMRRSTTPRRRRRRQRRATTTTTAIDTASTIRPRRAPTCSS